MYLIKKIEQTTNMDDPKIYSKTIFFNNFRKLVSFITTYNQVFACGLGSDIEKNGELFCHTSDIISVQGDKSRISLKELNEYLKMDY